MDPRAKQSPPRRDALLLVVDDREDNRLAIAEAFERRGYAVLTAAGGRDALAQVADHSPDLMILDLKMPDVDGLEVLKTVRAAPSPPEVILLTAFGTVETAVEALQHGAFNYLTKPINLKDLRAQAEKALEHRQLHSDVKRYKRRIEVEAEEPWASEYVFESTAMKNMMGIVRRLAHSHSNVLVDGESGVGKEVVAQALHRAGPNPDERPFIVVHCAALPESLIEGELFGHERGAFTGADRQMIGRLELADGGTLFLDEIGEIPLSMQVKLLRVLEQRELTRVGGRHVIKVNFRLLAATNRNIEEEVGAGRFREDLYYRLNVVRLEVPPLRERCEDILPLFQSFLRRFAAEQGLAPPALTGEIERRLLDYPWPGNVRELRNLAECLTIFAAGRDISLDDLPEALLQVGAVPAAFYRREPGKAAATLLDLQQIERLTIEQGPAPVRRQSLGRGRSLGHQPADPATQVQGVPNGESAPAGGRCGERRDRGSAHESVLISLGQLWAISDPVRDILSRLLTHFTQIATLVANGWGRRVSIYGMIHGDSV